MKPTIFEFTSYQFEPEKKRAVFRYKTEFSDAEPMLWTESIIFPRVPDTKDIPKKLLESLHLILGISYWKFHCATNVKIPYVLSKKEADFWNTVYKKGLGEFFYKNNLDPSISPEFKSSESIRPKPYTLDPRPFNKSLVGIGGGKDSIVVAELLKENGFDITAFVVESKESELISKIVETIGVDSLKIHRVLDEKVLQAHQYNGHIPISAIYAFLGILSCVLYNYKYFIVGNEYSSNFGNIKYRGLEVNHQWSKSFEFENLFSDYIKNFVSPDVHYFSLLRPFYEIRIVKLFSQYKKYFPYFSSCNKNFKIKTTAEKLWCLECPKCIFVFILLSAFLNKKELLEIFGKNIYRKEQLLPLFKDILGLGSMKPFDCVGVFKEAQTAFTMAGQRFLKAKKYPEVFKTNQATNIPEQFKFLGMERALILGYGKEGKVTKKYLKKQHPNLKIGIGDSVQDKEYLEKQSAYDIAIKTPGIKKELVTIPYTTATNIFFSKTKGANTIIGITGSKGKSTTSSLIYHILKTAEKNVSLLGNIGKPMMEALLYPIKKDAIFVLELSSYQLDDIKFSPDIAVVTNLFPEHMDFHGGLKNYYNAKKNIINFQNKNEHFVYNPKNKEVTSWLKDYRGKAIEFTKDNFESNLIGEHNQSNIQAAVSVARILKIPEEKIKEGIKSFDGLPHRLENIGTFKGVTFCDDAISTTPESTIMAIGALKNIDTIFLGGQDRGYDFSQLEKTIKKYAIKNIVLFPDSGNKMIKNKKGLNILKTSSMQEAVKFAYQHTQKGSVCLLSCASPSYSLWKNFEEKGDQFKAMVKKLSK